MLELFNKAKESYLCNTSYPLDKSNFQNYKVDSALDFDEDKLCLYIHIPFCTRLCAFCEYVKFRKDNVVREKEYLDILERDIDNFLANHKFKLYGFDIGGGTPTCLELDNFKRLMTIAKKINNLDTIEDFEPSIEATFDTLSEEKIKLISDAGFKRISLGIQTTNTKILTTQNRNIITIDKMKETFELIHKYDIKKINVDFMYGIIGQNIEDIKKSLECVEIINPEQVTLYEMRYNMVNFKDNNTKESLFDSYSFIYEELVKMGYKGRFSQNTFSKYDDYGLSSYLRYRMIENISYKGFGISAQSKSKKGISYNIGKNHETFEECISNGTFIEGDTYLLPSEELVAKYVMISLYFGMFKLDIISAILGTSATQYFKDEIEFLVNNKFITITDNNECYLTRLGFKYYGAIGALFYSKKVKEWFMGV